MIHMAVGSIWSLFGTLVPCIPLCCVFSLALLSRNAHYCRLRSARANGPSNLSHYKNDRSSGSIEISIDIEKCHHRLQQVAEGSRIFRRHRIQASQYGPSNSVHPQRHVLVRQLLSWSFVYICTKRIQAMRSLKSWHEDFDNIELHYKRHSKAVDELLRRGNIKWQENWRFNGTILEEARRSQSIIDETVEQIISLSEGSEKK